MDTKQIHWLGHSAFRIEDESVQLYFDPYKLSAKLPKADIIFITHSHYDHYSQEDIAKIKKDGTIFVAPSDVVLQIGKGAIVVSPGTETTVGRLHIRAVPAYNLNKNFHPKNKQWVGYIITLSNGHKIYHAGDTDNIPEMRTISADIALLPCGGTYTMTAQEAAAAANIFKPKVVIPMHWGDIIGSKSDATDLQKLFSGETIIKSQER